MDEKRDNRRRLCSGEHMKDPRPLIPTWSQQDAVRGVLAPSLLRNRKLSRQLAGEETFTRTIVTKTAAHTGTTKTISFQFA